MGSLRNIVLASAVAFTFVSPAFAQDIMREITDRQALMIDPGGRVSMMNVNDAGHRMLMKYAKPVKAGTFFYMSGGTLYVAQDRLMANGVSLREQLVHATP